MNCVTFHYDNARTGLLVRDTARGAAAGGRPWGKYRELNLGSPVRGAVLFLENWPLRGGRDDSETQTILFVATSGNEVFAFSEDELRAGPAAPIWQTKLDPPVMRRGSNIPPPVGVCSTGVLDPAHRRMFLAAMTSDRQGHESYRIYALSVDTGQILAAAPITDPGAQGRPTFVGSDHDQRGALIIVGDRVYVTFADFLADDQGPYRGWVVGCQVDNLSDQWFVPVTNRANGGGIWGPGGAAATDSESIFVVTGNAPTADTDSYWDSLGPGHPGDLGDYFEAVARVGASWSAVATAWTAPVKVPNWFGAESQAGSVTVADINGSGRPDLVVFHIDNPSGGNHGYYRIGWDVDTAGNVTGGWTAPIQIPGWFGAENQGGGIAVADLNGNGRPDLIVFHIDNPSGANRGFYRVGWNVDKTGNVTGGWTAPIQIPGWFGSENQGGGIAVADLDGDGRPELIVFHIDNPGGENHGYYRIGWAVDASGNVTGGWTSPTQIPGWFGSENQGGGIAVADVNGNGQPDLVVFHIDNPAGGNHGYFRIGWDVDATGNVTGGWTTPTQIPGWFGSENQGGGIVVADINGNGRPDMVVFHIDNPPGENHGYYRIGWDLGTSPSLGVLDWYLPTNAKSLNHDDLDLGGSSAMVVPSARGDAHPMLVTSGKDGDVYLLDRTHLGRWGGELSRVHSFNGEARCAPAFYMSMAGDRHAFISGHGSPGFVAFKVVTSNGQPQLAEIWRARDRNGNVLKFGNAAGSPIVVSTPSSDRLAGEVPLVWVLDGGDDGSPTLHAFYALDGREIFSSSWVPEDALTALPHYPPMNCSQRSVFVGTNEGIACYRLPRIGRTSRLSMVVFHIDHPSGGNHGYYRFGWDIDPTGNPVTWDPPLEIPGWFGAENQGGSIAVADINGNGRPDLVAFHIDNPSGANQGYYRIGWDVDAGGNVAGGWTVPIQIPGWFGSENQGGGIAVADINGSGRPDLIVFHIDNPSGENHGYYRIGWDVDAAGIVNGGWTAPVRIPHWFGAESQGGGIAIADIKGSGRPDLVVFHIDNPSGGNHGYYRIGWDVDASGNVTGGWTQPIQIPGWFGAENQGGGIAVADVNGSGRPDLIVFHVDNPSGANHGYYRIGWDVDVAGNVTGGWTAPIRVPGWFGSENQAGGIAVAAMPWSWEWS
jgi:hypothetical protein